MRTRGWCSVLWSLSPPGGEQFVGEAGATLPLPPGAGCYFGYFIKTVSIFLSSVPASVRTHLTRDAVDSLIAGCINS